LAADVFEITDPEFERKSLTDTLTLYKVRNEVDEAQRIKHDGFMFFFVGPPQFALDKFRTVLYVKLLDATHVEICVPKISGSFVGNFTSGKQQMVAHGQLTTAQVEALDSSVTFFNECTEPELRRKILVEFKNGVELSLRVTRLEGGTALGQKYGFAAPTIDVVNGRYTEEISQRTTQTTDVWASFFIPQVEARPLDPTTDSAQSGNLLYANLSNRLRGMNLE